MKKCIAIALVLLLCGCASSGTESEKTFSEKKEEVLTEENETSLTSENLTEVQTTTVTTTVSSESTSAETTAVETTAAETTMTSMSDDDIRKIAEDSITGHINWFDCDDYDGDGMKEAFILVGDEKNEDGNDYNYCKSLMFITSSGETKVVDDELLGDLFYFHSLNKFSFSDKRFFSFSATAGGSGAAGYIFGVNGNNVTKYDISSSPGKADYSSFHTDESGIVYAVSDEFYSGHQWFDNLVEYDPASDSFSVTENDILTNAKKYAQIVIDNEDIWLPTKEELENQFFMGGVFNCGYADVDNDNIPEFIVSGGSLSVYGHTAYWIYHFDGSKMIPYKLEENQDPDYENAVITCFDESLRNPDWGDGVSFPFCFIQDKQTGKVRVIEAYSGGSAGSFSSSLSEYFFENETIRSELLVSESNAYNNELDKVIYSFSGKNGECDAKTFLSVYDSIFDEEKNNINNSVVLGIPLYRLIEQDIYCYPEYSKEEKESILVKEYLAGIPSFDMGEFPFVEAYTSVGNDHILPLGAIVDEIR